MALNLEEYLQRISEASEKSEECERFLETLCSDEVVNIMWQTFVLQCNEAMNGNESVYNAIEVHDLSIRYLSALMICRRLFTRFNSVTRIIYDLENVEDFDISETTQKFIEEKRLFKRLYNEERKDKVEELLRSIQDPIDQKNQDVKTILEHMIQRHCEIIYTSMLLSNNDRRDELCMAVKSAFLCPNKQVISNVNKCRILGLGYDFYNLKSFLCFNLYYTLNEFHTYLAEISNKEVQL